MKYREAHIESLGINESVKPLAMFAEIIKLKITVFVAFTTALGYVLKAQSLTIDFLYPVAGIFILACGAAALNHYQERKTDALMPRTMGRPLPSGMMSPLMVLSIAFALLLTGGAVLYYGANLTTLLIGLVTFYWYNGFYTPLKKKSSLAIIPGSIVGALPPVAGWAAAGGDITNIKILYIAFYFFLWQIPHFWLLLLKYAEDYKKGGFPVFTEKMGKNNLAGMTYYLIIATSITGALIPAFGIVQYNLTAVLLLVVSLWMCYMGYRFITSEKGNKAIIKTFICINIYTLLIITLLTADKLIKLI